MVLVFITATAALARQKELRNPALAETPFAVDCQERGFSSGMQALAGRLPMLQKVVLHPHPHAGDIK